MSDHPELEMLTAFADGELPPDEHDAVEDHLRGCAACATVVELELATSGLLRGLGPVEPPAGFLDRVAVRGPAPRSQLRHHTRFALANIAAAAAVWVGVVGVARLTTGGETVRPAFAELVGAHTASSLVGFDRIAVRTSEAVPGSLGRGYRLVDSQVSDGRREAHYSDGAGWLSMYVEPGRLDTASLPDDARPLDVAGARAWALRLGADDVAVVERDGTVIVLVGADSATVVGAVAGDAPSPSVGDRVAAAARGLLDCFGLG